MVQLFCKTCGKSTGESEKQFETYCLDHIDLSTSNDLNEAAIELYKRKCAYGQKLIDEFGGENIVLGLGTVELVEIMTKLELFQNALRNGALMTAYQIGLQLEPSASLPQERIDKYLQKILEFDT